LSINLAQRIGLHHTLHLSLSTYVSYIEALADAYYDSNSYHNFTHATDVLLVICHLLLRCGARQHMSQWEEVACFLAAHAHDVGHPGTNNKFQVLAKTSLGTKYGTQATLEVYSADLGEELLLKHGVLDSIDPVNRAKVLSVFRSSILATDMAQHVPTCLALRHLPADLFGTDYPLKHSPQTNATNGDYVHALSLPALLLHAADISGSCREGITPWYTRSFAVAREFIYQGDCERANRIPVTESFDRQILLSEGLDGFQRREKDFTKDLVLPYYKDVERVWNGMSPLRSAIETNLAAWEDLDKELLTKTWKDIFM
jgi:3'5'-cyclic nucleotide phosphodiesterase